MNLSPLLRFSRLAPIPPCAPGADGDQADVGERKQLLRTPSLRRVPPRGPAPAVELPPPGPDSLSPVQTAEQYRRASESSGKYSPV